jgi:hypothetical protein
MQFFGNYLLNRGLVTPAALADALHRQSDTRLSLDVLAVNAGYLTAAQVDAAYTELQKTDKNVGEVMADLGFLTKKQVDELLDSQPPGHLTLGQALVDGGHLTDEQFEAALAEYKKENEISEADFREVKDFAIKMLVQKFCNIMDEESSKYITSYLTLLFKNIIRFIGDDFAPLDIEYTKGRVCNKCVAQKIRGLISAVTIIDADESSMAGFASRFSKENLTDADEYSYACASEFLNLHNGLYAVNLSNEEGGELGLDPQIAYEDYSLEYLENVYTVPLCFSFGAVNIVISFFNEEADLDGGEDADGEGW